METVKLSQFIENPDNPQTVTDEAFADLVESVRRDPETLAANKIAYCTDYVSPISNTSFVGQRVVMAGNKRLRALKTIHGPEADVNADYFFDLTPLGVEARRRWLVRSNVQTGEWEMETLMKLYSKDELQTMMSPDALGEILETLETPEPTEGKTDPDEIPDVDETEAPASKRGGVYVLGNHRLMCGDSTVVADVQRLMRGEKADVLITDPPYNVDYEGSAGKIMNDSMSDKEFRSFLAGAYGAADSQMREGAVFYIWHAGSEGYNFLGAARDIGWKIRECLVWVKDLLVFGRQDYQWRHEPCLYGWKDGAAHTWNTDRKQTTVIEMPKPTASKLHPTMKPVELFAYQINNSSESGNVVLDIFGGSGTTAIACEKNGRNARLMELNPHYCDVIRKRWAEFVHGEGCDWKSLTPEVSD